VRLIAEQCRVDLVRKIGPEVSWDETEAAEIPDEDLALTNTLIELAEEREEMYRAADELWLGFSPDLTEQERSRRILAGHLFFNQGLSWSEICDLLNRNGSSPPVTRAQLDRWLADPSTVLGLAFRSLYQDNHRLAASLLNLPDGEEAKLTEIAAIAESEGAETQAPGNWTWPEVRVLIWRYRDAERHDRILAREACDLNKQELRELCDRCLEQFPFPKIMERLISELGRWPEARKALATPGLWQRLVFEYYCKDTTIHQDIHDRTSAAAQPAPYNLTMGMLNVWLSNGRLAAKLATFVQNGRSSQ
jgi:hypothetical protein